MAIVLLLIVDAVAVPLLIIPLTAVAVVEVADTDIILILLASVVLPIVLLVMFTVVPPEAAIPLNPVARLVALPTISIPEIVLCENTIVPPAPDLNAMNEPLATVVVKVIAPFTVAEPIVLPVPNAPTFTFPFAILIAYILLVLHPPVKFQFVNVLL